MNFTEENKIITALACMALIPFIIYVSLVMLEIEIDLGQVILIVVAILGWRITHMYNLKQQSVAFKNQQRFKLYDSMNYKINIAIDLAHKLVVFFASQPNNTPPVELMAQLQDSCNQVRYYLHDYSVLSEILVGHDQILKKQLMELAASTGLPEGPDRLIRLRSDVICIQGRLVIMRERIREAIGEALKY